MRPIFWHLGLLVVPALMMSACGKDVPVPEAPRPVLTQLVGEKNAVQQPVYTGEVRSRYETSLAFRIPGKIVARLVDAGARVKAGDVLARLDPADTALSQASAEAQFKLAEAELRRYQDLRARNFVSQSALDAKETTYAAARAQSELARNQQGYTVLRADRDGIIDQVLVEAGQVVAAGQTVMRHSRSDTLEVAVAIPESHLGSMYLKQGVEISLWADEQARYRGAVRELSSTADPVTRTYAARVSILNPDNRLHLGMTASVRLTPDASGQTVKQGNGNVPQLSVPMTAIFQQGGKPAVWVVGSDQTLLLRPVTVVAFGDERAVLKDGLVSGERVVVAGVHKLVAGDKIRMVDQSAAQ